MFVRKTLATGLVILLCWLPAAALAQDIFDGWYFDPQEAGWGINVEVQDGIMFLALFTYRKSNGAPVWYTGSSRFDYSANPPVFAANLELFASGSCFTCGYRSPDIGVAGDGGHIRIAFNNLGNVVVTWQGRTATLEKFYWAYGSRNDFLFGTWAIVRGIGPVFADYYLLNRRIANDGDPFVAGTSTGGYPVVASFNSELGDYGMLERVSFSDGTTSDWFYIFVMSKEQMVGHYWIVDPGDAPIGDGIEFVGFRLGQQEIPKRTTATKALRRYEAMVYQATGKSLNRRARAIYRRLKAQLGD